MKRVQVSSAAIDSLQVPDLDLLWLAVVARLAISAGLRLVLSWSDSFATSKGRNGLLVDNVGEGANASEHEATSTTKTIKLQTLIDIAGPERDG